MMADPFPETAPLALEFKLRRCTDDVNCLFCHAPKPLWETSYRPGHGGVRITVGICEACRTGLVLVPEPQMFQVGQKVSIYEDPLTERKPEVMGEVLEVGDLVGWYNGRALRRYLLRIDEALTVERSILEPRE